MHWNEMHETGDHWIIAVDGKAVDIRGTVTLALQQRKNRRRQCLHGSTVTIHYGPCSAATHLQDGKIEVSVAGKCDAGNHIATCV